MEFLIKETKNNGTLLVKEISYDLAKELTVKNHYSHKWNTAFGKLNYGIFKKENTDECLGVAVFGNLMNPNSYKKNFLGLEKENVLELNRLWLSDILLKNAETVFLSMCFKLMKENNKKIKFIQSFADGRLGCGTIYKASNFKYYGKSSTLFFENLENGEVLHKVPTENTKRPARMLYCSLLYSIGILRSFEVYSYRYIYALDKRDYKLVNLKEESYPIYHKGKNNIGANEFSKQVLARSYLFSKWMNVDKEITINIKKTLENYTDEEIMSLAKSPTFDEFLELGTLEFEKKYKNNFLKILNDGVNY